MSGDIGDDGCDASAAEIEDVVYTGNRTVKVTGNGNGRVDVDLTGDPDFAVVIGVILATGAYMILKNCLGGFADVSVDLTAVIMTAALGAVYYGSRKIIKRGISPIVLICIAGVAGVLAYGW